MKKLIDITVELKRETAKAWLVTDGTRDAWIPKSQAEFFEERPGVWVLTLPEWLALEKGLI